MEILIGADNLKVISAHLTMTGRASVYKLARILRMSSRVTVVAHRPAPGAKNILAEHQHIGLFAAQ